MNIAQTKDTDAGLPNEAPSNSRLPSVIVNSPVAKPAAAIHRLAMGTYFKMLGIWPWLA